MLSDFVLVAEIGAIGLAVAAVAFVTTLSLRALRRGAELEAEVKAPSFAFRLHLHPRRRPGDTLARGQRAAPPPPTGLRT